MKWRKYILTGGISLLCCSGFLQAQFGFPGVGVFGPVLQDKIQIQYLQQPNTRPLAIMNLLKNLIKTRGSNLLFGAVDNSGMKRSAELVDALFKQVLIFPPLSVSKNASPDTRFQETIYQALMLANRPIRICFINDTEGIRDEFLAEYRFYYKSMSFMGNDIKVVWPGVFRDAANGDVIVIGEGMIRYLSMSELKRMLISLVTQAALNDYGPLYNSVILGDVNNPEGKPYKVHYAQSDRRRIENQAIADAMILYYQERFRNEVYEWLLGGRTFYLPVSEAELYASSDDEAPGPVQRYSLRDRFLRINDQDGGKPLNQTGNEFLDQFTRNWREYNIFDLKGDKTHTSAFFSFQNDLFLGVFYYQFIRAFGITQFREAILYDQNKYTSVKPQLRTLFLLQNLCLSLMRDKDIAYIRDNPGSEEARNAQFPLAIFSFLAGMGFEVPDAATYKKTAQTITDAATIQSRGAFDELLQLYLGNWQKKLKTGFTADDPGDNDDGYIFNKTARIARLMGIK